MNIGTSAPVQRYPSNVIKFEEQNIYYSLVVITKFCYGKTRSTSKPKAFSIMFYTVSLEHEISRKERRWYVLKISYFLITWTLLVLQFDPNTTLLFTLISQPKKKTPKKSTSIKVVVSLLRKKQDIIIHTVIGSCLTQRADFHLQHCKFLQMKPRI